LIKDTITLRLRVSIRHRKTLGYSTTAQGVQVSSSKPQYKKKRKEELFNSSFLFQFDLLRLAF